MREFLLYNRIDVFIERVSFLQSKIAQGLNTIQKQYAWLWVLPLLLVLFAIALPLILRDALWLDEVYTHMSSGTGGFESINLAETVLRTALYDLAWPPLYYIVQNIWGSLSGNSLLSERLLPALFGLLSLAMTYRLGKDLRGHLTGLLATVLTGTSAIFLFYMHETRAYTIYVFFCLLMVWLYWQIISRTTYEVRWLRWGFPFAIAGALYTHYVAAAFVIAIAIYHILSERPISDKAKKRQLSRERWLNILRLWFNGCLLFAPWSGVLLTHILFERGSSRSSNVLDIIDYTLFSFTNNTWILAIPLMLLSLPLIKQRPIRFLWLWFVMTMLLIAIMNTAASFLFHPRHFLALLPIMALLIAITLVQLSHYSHLLALTFVGIWIGMGLIAGTHPNFLERIERHVEPVSTRTIESLYAVTEQCVQADDHVIFAMDDFAVEHDIAAPFRLYYFANTDYDYSYLSALLADEKSVTELPEEIQTLPYAERVQATVADAPQVWFFLNQGIDVVPETLLLNDILANNGYTNCGIIQENGALSTWLYAQGDRCDVVLRACTIDN